MDRKTNKVDPKKVKANDLMAFTYYTKVKTVRSSDELIVADLDGGSKDIRIQGSELIENAFSADQYEEEVKVSKTQAAEILVNSPNRPLTVCFDKTDGSQRVLRGRLVGAEPLLGRSMVEDMDVADKNRLRQVDHRTLHWLIVEGVKYVVK